MTWGDLKRAVEAAGISDETPIWYIDVTYPEISILEVDVRDEELIVTTI